MTHSTFPYNFVKAFAFLCVFSLGFAFSSQGMANAISVETDRQTVEYGDIVTLKITADFQVNAKALDLDVLESDFEVLGSQRSNNIQMINGDFQSSTNWVVQLLPKREGKLIIPEFELEGTKSLPYTLTVTPYIIQHEGTALKPFFLESTVDQTTPYIQEQVVYTLRFFHQGRYVDGMIRPPKFDKMLLEPLKEQSVYQKKIQGKNYTVYEWIYALYPQSSGEIKIDPPIFNGRIQYAGQLRPIKEFAKGITLDVIPEPALFKEQATNTWLPAKSLTLAETWTQPAGDLIRIGDTLTQTVTMTVQSIKASQLPNLTLLPQTDYKVYPEKPQSKEEASASGITSIKQFKRSIIPTKAGTLRLPERTVYWWNTQSNQLDKTTLPAKTFEIQTVVVEQQNLVDCTLPSQGLTATPDGKFNQPTRSVSSVWQWLSALLAVLWITTSIVLIRQKRQPKITQTSAVTQEAQDNQIKTQQAWSNIDVMCQLPADQLYPALKQWLKTEHQIQHFSELHNPSLQSLIQQLEASLYNESPLKHGAIEQLAEALKSLNEAKGKNSAGLLKSKTSADSKLADLYER